MENASNGVFAGIGNTPLVELRRVVPASGARVVVKLEWANPTGSMKDRMARPRSKERFVTDASGLVTRSSSTRPARLASLLRSCARRSGMAFTLCSLMRSAWRSAAR